MRLQAHDTLPMIPHEVRRLADFAQTSDGWRMILVGAHAPSAFPQMVARFRALGVRMDDEGYLLR